MTTPTPTPTAPAYRVRFVYDPDASLDTPSGEPLPGTAEAYAENEIHELINKADDPATGARRIVPYEEYCQYYGNPDRHVVIGAVLERQCACCASWTEAGSLWGIDFMDDSPELGGLRVLGVDERRHPSAFYAPDSPEIRGYLREVVQGLIAEATAAPTADAHA